ncbi:hypothetical protein L1987_45040 [Smallanthus sonchifolius]|uniref:Uncharacterized protein n=1 Tax=Smallanthus sonchifolius TaxID=185202 RepID=A0ACB9GR34_9ASTR|nr:hypothetical protein L1987_45040 [Smallanthus sonchifolius]
MSSSRLISRLIDCLFINLRHIHRYSIIALLIFFSPEDDLDDVDFDPDFLGKISPPPLKAYLLSQHANAKFFYGVKDHSRRVAEMIGLGSDAEFWKAGVGMMLDIDCGFGSFGAHLLSLKLMVVCMAAYELTGSQVQSTLESGLPAIIGNIISRKFSFFHHCHMTWFTMHNVVFHGTKKVVVFVYGMFLIEPNLILNPGGYFVLNGTSLSTGSMIEGFTHKVCWTLIGRQEETFIWQKTTDPQCYSSR